MPNWCANSLKLTATNEKSREMLKKLIDGLESDSGFLNVVIPVPEELKDTMSGFYGDLEKRKAHELQQKDNIAKYGYADWYDFCNHKWGTKWDIKLEHWESEKTDQIVVWFDTAWSPPIPVYEELEEIGFKVEATYCECGCEFAGIYANEEEETYNISFYEEGKDKKGPSPEIQAMIEFFEGYGLNHSPSHLGG